MDVDDFVQVLKTPLAEVRLEDLLESVMDKMMAPQMDWNSRFAVQVEGEWYPVVGWNHYPFNSEVNTLPILYGLEGPGVWGEHKGDVEYRIILSEHKWTALIEKGNS
jgi:hypothetical protein